MFFVYGSDFKRQRDIFLLPGNVRDLIGVIATFSGFASIILYVLRRKLKLRRNGLFSAIVDTLIPFIGGGNVQMRHKHERWFFGIVISAAFFMMTIWSSVFLYYTCSFFDQKIETFNQLAELKPSIYLYPNLLKFKEHVLEKMRFALKQIQLNLQNCLCDFCCRSKIAPRINYKGEGIDHDLFQNHTSSFAFVIFEAYVNRELVNAKHYSRDVDVLRETLGMVS